MGADRWLKRASGLLVPNMNFGQRRRCPGCCGGECDCVRCIQDMKCRSLQVTFSGWVNGTCGNCNELNDTFILTQLPLPQTCLWEWEGTLQCGTFSIQHTFDDRFPDGTYAVVTVCEETCGEDCAVFEARVGSTVFFIDCDVDGALDGVELSRITSEVCNPALCDHTGATALLEVVP